MLPYISEEGDYSFYKESDAHLIEGLKMAQLSDTMHKAYDLKDRQNGNT